VEASNEGYPGRVRLDLDLEKSSWWFDPEVDIDFDLRYQAQCSDDQTQVLVDVTTENLQVNVDYDWFAEALSLILPCGAFATPIADQPIPDCIDALERHIEDKIYAAFTPIRESFREAVPAGARCVGARVDIDPSANVSLVFDVQLPTTVNPPIVPPILPIKRLP
jgi:hypothetical protein